MQTFSFEVHVSGHVKIDAESEEAAIEEFTRDFSQEVVLVTPKENQILVLTGMAWKNPEEDNAEEEEESNE